MKLKTRIKHLQTPNHGSSTGEWIDQVQYFNPVKCEWTPIRRDVELDIKAKAYRDKLKNQA